MFINHDFYLTLLWSCCVMGECWLSCMTDLFEWRANPILQTSSISAFKSCFSTHSQSKYHNSTKNVRVIDSWASLKQTFTFTLTSHVTRQNNLLNSAAPKITHKHNLVFHPSPTPVLHIQNSPEKQITSRQKSLSSSKSSPGLGPRPSRFSATHHHRRISS